jgi:glycerophosphoryl diester phosphodiesterase
MLKSKSISLLLIAAMLMSMLAVFPAMTVNAVSTIQISNVEPAIPAIVGSEITLSEYSVQLNDGTILAPGDITWYNGTSVITKFTPAAAGVTKLTAKKTSDNSVSKSIYVVAKQPNDSEYVLFSTDFNSASDIDGWNKIDKTDGTYTVSNGKLTIKGGTNNPRIYLPSWLADFGDYRIDVEATQTDNADPQRWVSVIYRAQNAGSTGLPYYHMCVRNTMSSAATSNSGGVELCYYNSGWTYVKTTSYIGTINPNRNYTFSVLAKGSTVQYQIDGDVVIHVEDVPLINNDTATKRGGIGLQANSSKFVVDSIKVTLQQTVPVKPEQTNSSLLNVRQPISNTLNHITNVGIVQSKAEFDSYDDPKEDAPSTLIMYANGSKLTTENGTEIGTIEALMQKAENLTFIPAFYVKDNATVDKIVAACKGVGFKDILFISNDYNIVKYAREKYTLARGAVDFSSMKGYALTDAQLLEIRGTVRKAASLIAILPDNLATKSIVSELQAMEITVWVMDKSLSGDTEAAKLITSGATGIVTDKFIQIENAMKTLVEPNTLTKTPLIIGHRGNPSVAPENSISSYLAAFKNGADIVETDIQFTKDKVIVAMHDDTIDRTTTGTGKVSDLTLEQIKQAYLYADKPAFQTAYPNEKVPTWEEMLKAVQPTNGRIFCEIKTSDPSIIQPAVDLVKKYGMENRVSFICFTAAQLIKLQQVMPTMTGGWLNSSLTSSTDMTEAVNALEAQLNTLQSASSTFNPNYPNLSKYFVDAAIDRGITIWPWTYNTGAATNFNKHFLWGLDGLTTDDSQYSKDYVKYISSDKNAIVLSGNGASSQFIISSMTYGDTETEITKNSNTFARVLEGSNLISVSGGKVTAKAVSGTASFMVYYKTKTAQGQEYILYTQPITVTIGSDTGIRLNDSSEYKIGEFITGIKPNTTLSTLLGNFRSSDKLVVSDANNNIITDSSKKIGTGAKILYVDNGNVIDEMTVVLLGDIDGDAILDSTDVMLQKKACLGNYKFNAVQIAAGCFEGGTVPTSLDYMLLKKLVLGNLDFETLLK